MKRSRSLLDEALEAWTFARQGVTAELRNLPESALLFRPTEPSRSTLELVHHIVESGLMMSGELSRPDGDFRRKAFPEFIAEYARNVSRHRTKKALLEVLKESHSAGEQTLRRAGEIGLLQTIRQFNGEYATRLSWMYHGIAHEEYHRGQLALYARLVGRVPALTRLIHGA